MRPSFLASSLLALCGLIGCVTPAQAGRWVDVTVINRSTGERLTPYRHAGKLYVAGRPGDRYGIELRNRDGGRVMTVVSVDGINVLNGQTAAPLQSGYVLEGRQPYAITGWRKSMDEVAQFIFTALPDSYAARTDRPDNVGVIGVAVFREKVEAAAPYPEASFNHLRRESDTAQSQQRPASAPAPAALAKSLGAASSAANVASADESAASGPLADRRMAAESMAEKSRQRLGTGHGERESAPTRSTAFARASDHPDEVLTIYYDSRPNLVARGVIRAPQLTEPQRFPSPFPGGFVPDPRG